MKQARDDQFEAEVTDPDEIDPVDFPPDRPLGVGDLLAEDVAAAGDYAPDTLRRRDLRTQPDVARADDVGMGVVAPAGLTDTAEPGEPDWDVVDPGAALSDSAAAGHQPTDTWPAEEAALHLEEGPPDDRAGDDLDDEW